MVGGNEHVASAEVNLLVQLQGHGHGRRSLRQVAVVSDDGAHLRFSSRRKRDDRITGTNDSACDATGEAAKRGVRANHGLYREAKPLKRILFGKRDSFKVLQQRGTVILRHALAAIDDVVSLEGADGHALHVGNSQLSREHQEIVLQFAEDIFAVAGQIHLVDGGEYIGNSEEGSDEGVTSRLGEETFCSVNQNNRQIRRGRARRHISRVLFVSWSIGNDEFAPRRREIAVSHVDGDALFAFGTQAIGEQRKIDWSSRAVDAALLHRSKLIFVHGLGIVQETPDEG